MARILHSIVSFTVRKSDRMLLALSWVFGLGFGGFVFRYAGSDLVSQMPLAAKCQPSIFGLLTVTYLPFLFSAFAVMISTPKLLHMICFCKAFLFGYASCGVFAAFGEGSWLVRWMLLFTDIWGAALLYFFCQRHVSGVRQMSWPLLSGYFLAVFGICWVDISFISPLLRKMLL